MFDRRNAWRGAMALLLWMTASVVASGASPAQVGDLPGAGPYQQFIVKYRDGSEPQNNEAAVQARLDATVARSGLAGAGQSDAVKLRWQRRLAVAADVFKADRPLDRAEAARLMQQFAADADVEYIEVDGIVTHQNGSTMMRPMMPSN